MDGVLGEGETAVAGHGLGDVDEQRVRDGVAGELHERVHDLLGVVAGRAGVPQAEGVMRYVWMCSGARSSSAKGAMARRAAAESSWSISRRSVLSLWTIRQDTHTSEVRIIP